MRDSAEGIQMQLESHHSDLMRALFLFELIAEKNSDPSVSRIVDVALLAIGSKTELLEGFIDRRRAETEVQA